MTYNTDIIAFFSGEGFFKLRNPERQQERFDALKEAFESEFEREASDADFDMLIAYQTEKREARKAKEVAKIKRDAEKPIATSQEGAFDHVRDYPAGIYILTCAQNNTHVDRDFLKSLENMAAYYDATILAAKTLYNKGAFAQPDIKADSEDIWFDEAIQPYLTDEHCNLDGKFHFIGNANIIPTAKNPLSGFEGITLPGIHAILPATKIALKVIPALKGADITIQTATGSVTKRNYIMRKAGAVASIEHNIGAVIVDTWTNTIVNVEQMEGTKGFYLGPELFFGPDKVETPKNHVAAINLGDMHCEKMKNWQNISILLDTYKPQNIVVHDVLDFSSRNHHNIKDPVFMFAQETNGATVEQDLEIVSDHIEALLEYSNKVHVVESNHDLALERWLKETDFKQDPTNALVYLTCMKEIYTRVAENNLEGFNLLQFALSEFGSTATSKANYLKTDQSLIIAGVEMGCHGHNGINGSRGSPAQFRKLGVPMNTGHTHSPSIIGRVYTAGVSASLDMDYNKGPSSWAIAHIVTYENGQRAIIFS